MSNREMIAAPEWRGGKTPVKLCIWYRGTDGPWGGSNSFLTSLGNCLKGRGIEVVSEPTADCAAVILNSFTRGGESKISPAAVASLGVLGRGRRWAELFPVSFWLRCGRRSLVPLIHRLDGVTRLYGRTDEADADGCSDNTLAEIRRAGREDRVKVFEFPRGGKVSVINALLREVRQPYVVMTDANSMFRPQAVSELLARLRPGVGVVCGRLLLVDEHGRSGEGLYWRLETYIKKLESAFASVIGANGAIYLFRRELFEPLPEGTINDDFSISMRLYQRGYGVVYAPEAVAAEPQITSDSEEFRRHVRDAAGHFRALVYLKSLLNPRHGRRFFFYVSHRVLRWLAPFFLLAAFLLNALLAARPGYNLLFAGQCLAYGIGAAAYLLRLRWRPLHLAYYFLLLNLAILSGFFKNLLGRQPAAWESTRR